MQQCCPTIRIFIVKWSVQRFISLNQKILFFLRIIFLTGIQPIFQRRNPLFIQLIYIVLGHAVSGKIIVVSVIAPCGTDNIKNTQNALFLWKCLILFCNVIRLCFIGIVNSPVFGNHFFQHIIGKIACPFVPCVS